VQKLREKFAAHLSLPKEIALDLPLITLTGRREVIIENYKNISEFSETAIRVRTKEGEVTVTGERLVLQQITSEILLITGRVGGIKW